MGLYNKRSSCEKSIKITITSNFFMTSVGTGIAFFVKCLGLNLCDVNCNKEEKM